MARGIHTSVQDTDNAYPMLGEPVVDDLATHTMEAVPFSNMVTGSAVFRIARQQLERTDQVVGIVSSANC